jgi:hypothetical protein
MLLASPTLYPGQTVRARVSADSENPEVATCRLFVRIYGADDQLELLAGPEASLTPGRAGTLAWAIPETGGRPIAQIGVELRSAQTATVYLDYLTWDGEPDAVFQRPADNGKVWRRAWVEGLDSYERWWPEAFRIIHNEGRGLLITGTREWRNYAAESTLTPHMCDVFGLGVRVQGMCRFYALLLSRTSTGMGVARLVKALDGDTVLAEAPFDWSFGAGYAFRLEADGVRLRGRIVEIDAGGPEITLEAADPVQPLEGGGVALIVETGRIATDQVRVAPIR